jgi:putative transposase
MARRRKFTAEFKAQVVLAILSGQKTAAEVCREYGLKPSVLSVWKATLLANAPKLFENGSQTTQEQVRIAELERLAGRLTLELEIVKKASSIFLSTSNRNGQS